jgi:hypothetical protein
MPQETISEYFKYYTYINKYEVGMNIQFHGGMYKNKQTNISHKCQPKLYCNNLKRAEKILANLQNPLSTENSP